MPHFDCLLDLQLYRSISSNLPSPETRWIHLQQKPQTRIGQNYKQGKKNHEEEEPQKQLLRP